MYSFPCVNCTTTISLPVKILNIKRPTPQMKEQTQFFPLPLFLQTLVNPPYYMKY